MRLNLFIGFLGAVLFLSPFAADLRSEEEARQVEVQRVQFGNAQPEGAGRNWREIEVDLDVRGSADRDVVNPRFIDNVQVEINLSFEVSRGEVQVNRFYRSYMEIPTLERGRHSVHFFLPPEIVSRDRITGDPQAYLVKLSVDGVEQELSSRAMSRILERDSVRESFLGRIESEAGSNDGILLPIHLTPFGQDRRYLRDVPSVRRVGNR